MEKNFTFSSSAIERLRIRLTWAQLELLPCDADEFQLIIAGDDESIDDLRIEQTGDDLIVAQPQITYAKDLLPRRRWLQICICVPEAWQGKVSVDTVSGIIGAHGVSAAEISLTTVSASLNVQNLAAEEALVLHSVSGAVSANTLQSRRCSLRTVSGDIKATGFSVREAKLFTVSGNVEMDVEPEGRNIDGQTVSGSVLVRTNQNVKATLHSLSGQYTFGEREATEDSTLEISITSVSGNLTVETKK